MKRLLLIIIVSIFGAINPINAQEYTEDKHKTSNLPMQDVVYLKNGAVIKGLLLNNNTSDIMIQTRDGNIFVYKPEEIVRCEQEAMTHTFEGNRRIVDIEKTTLGVRAGLLINYSQLDDLYMDFPQNEFSPGFHIGATYEHSFTKTNRWFIQTGLDVQYMNARTTCSEYSDIIDGDFFVDLSYEGSTHALYLEIPAMISCKFKLSDNLIFYPNIGIAYSIGIAGKYNESVFYKDETLWSTSENCFYYEVGGDDGFEPTNLSIYDRHNLALKFGLNLTYKRLYFGAGAFCHIPSLMTVGFNITAGYNF